MQEKPSDCVTKMDVVCAFIPNASKGSVTQWFRREVHSNPALMRALRRVGYRKTLRTLSGRMVDLIERRADFLPGDGDETEIKDGSSGNADTSSSNSTKRKGPTQ